MFQHLLHIAPSFHFEAFIFGISLFPQASSTYKYIYHHSADSLPWSILSSASIFPISAPLCYDVFCLAPHLAPQIILLPIFVILLPYIPPGKCLPSTFSFLFRSYIISTLFFFSFSNMLQCHSPNLHDLMSHLANPSQCFLFNSI